MFKAILINKQDEQYIANLTIVDEQDLPEGDVLVQVSYSTLNYKDALAITGKSPVVRAFPMVAGIDLVGTVLECSSGQFAVGDQVLLNGWGVGEKHWSGLAEKARLQSDWLIPLPPTLTAKQAMSIGTAGYTAMLCVNALEQQGITPEKGKVLVTGANGGVGSFAIVILAKLGYQVIASTGRAEERDYLISLGATEIIDRAELSGKGKPLMRERWVAAIDSVGSYTLANVCASTQYGGVVAACGLAQGLDFPATVAPFILRGVTLKGVDSVMCPRSQRVQAWQRLSDILDDELITKITQEITLDDVIPTASKLFNGEVRGRVVVKI
ncbi:acrylyl-CoA reductase (NADPH) [Rodentibacter trehalosifermentans]|uniref:acrylyl-CoA reductase (NADPH) n=1 Tax=Rodentibacter trehalosifermentans TaxID=1908263 RepID=UPI00098531DF|nr:MDR family oxidoreductase [Rodentibacter trehalosifermentans]OOF51355.1 alcohol dehydrogenase [Rodentibacter trehalosifermentans]